MRWGARGGSPGTLERANVAGVRESVVAVASQLIEMAAQPDDPAGGWPLPYRSQSRTRPAGTIVSRGISRASPSGCLRPQRPIVPVGGARGGPAGAERCPSVFRQQQEAGWRWPGAWTGCVSARRRRQCGPLCERLWASRRARAPPTRACAASRLHVSELRPRRTSSPFPPFSISAHAGLPTRGIGSGAVCLGVGSPPRTADRHPLLMGGPIPPTERLLAGRRPPVSVDLRGRRRASSSLPNAAFEQADAGAFQPCWLASTVPEDHVGDEHRLPGQFSAFFQRDLEPGPGRLDQLQPGGTPHRRWRLSASRAAHGTRTRRRRPNSPAPPPGRAPCIGASGSTAPGSGAEARSSTSRTALPMRHPQDLGVHLQQLSSSSEHLDPSPSR